MQRFVKARRGRITIPKEVRDALEIGADSLLVVTVEDGKLLIQPVPVTKTMGSPWLKGLYDQIAPVRESFGELLEEETKPAIDAAPKKRRSRKAR